MDEKNNLYEKGKIYCHGSQNTTLERLQEVFGSDVFEIEQDYNKAFSLFAESAKKGNPNAQYCLGCCYVKGQGCNKNEDLSIFWYVKAAENGDESAKGKIFDLAMAYYKKKKWPLAIKLFKSLSDLNHEDSSFMYGWCLENNKVSEFKVSPADYYSKVYSPYKMVEIGDKFLSGTDFNIINYSTAFEWYKRAADLGYYKAIFSVGYCYEKGIGVRTDESKALMYYGKIENTEQQYEIGCDILSGRRNGHRWTNDYGIPKKWFERASEKGHIMAHFKLGVCYYFGYGCKEDKIKAENLFKIISDAESQYNIGYEYFTTVQTTRKDKDSNKFALEWFEKSGYQGYCLGLFMVGVCYMLGLGVKSDNDKANNYFEKIHNAEDQYKIAKFLDKRHNFSISSFNFTDEICYSWYKKAARQGHDKSQYVVGLFLLGIRHNDGSVQENPEEAVSWFRKAALQGHPKAQYELGRCLWEGYAIKQNYDEALIWLSMSSNQDNGEAQNLLGCMYDQGNGVLKDLKKAFNLFSLSANNRCNYAYYNLGLCYENGNGVERNLKKAYYWFIKARLSGITKATTHIEALKEDMLQ